MTKEMDGWRTGTVTSRHEWAPGLHTLTLDIQPEALVPGQFFNVGLRLGDEFVRRSYSAASAPGHPLEFFITRVEDGSLSPQLADLEPGDRLHVEPRGRGFFTLDYVPPARDLWLIATGTGLGPYLSMLREGALFSRFERVVLVHGVRRASHLAYRDELTQLAASAPLVTVPLVSRESVPGALSGRVTDALRSGKLEECAGRPIEAAHSHVLLCGNPAMIEEMTAAFEVRGLRRHRQRTPGHVTFEKYW